MDSKYLPITDFSVEHSNMAYTLDGDIHAELGIVITTPKQLTLA